MAQMDKELLPIGSVVSLKNSNALVMIAGYLAVTRSDPERVWDYSGFRFPIGYTSDEEIYCFNCGQIEVVYAYGYRDIETDMFIGRLKQASAESGTPGTKGDA